MIYMQYINFDIQVKWGLIARHYERSEPVKHNALNTS